MNKALLLLLLSISLASFQSLAEQTPRDNDELLFPEQPDDWPIPDNPDIPDFIDIPTQTAVLVSIGSNGAGDVSATIGAVRSIVGSAVANGIVDRFIVTSPRIDGPIPIEDGLSFCAEAGFHAGLGYNGFVDQLDTIAPADGGFYHVELTDHCSAVLDNAPGADGTCHVDDPNCQNDTDGNNVPPNLPPSCEADTCEEEDLPEFPIDDDEFVDNAPGAGGTCHVDDPNCQNDTDGDNVPPNLPPSCEADTCEEEDLPEFPIDNDFDDSAESFSMIW